MRRSRAEELGSTYEHLWDEWWEQFAWPFGVILFICLGVFAWLYWNTPVTPKRKRRQFPMDPPGPAESRE